MSTNTKYEPRTRSLGTLLFSVVPSSQPVRARAQRERIAHQEGRDITLTRALTVKRRVRQNIMAVQRFRRDLRSNGRGGWCALVSLKAHLCSTGAKSRGRAVNGFLKNERLEVVTSVMDSEGNHCILDSVEISLKRNVVQSLATRINSSFRYELRQRTERLVRKRYTNLPRIDQDSRSFRGRHAERLEETIECTPNSGLKNKASIPVAYGRKILMSQHTENRRRTICWGWRFWSCPVLRFRLSPAFSFHEGAFKSTTWTGLLDTKYSSSRQGHDCDCDQSNFAVFMVVVQLDIRSTGFQDTTRVLRRLAECLEGPNRQLITSEVQNSGGSA
ncbi:hypothetical protein C8R45DRAFT_1172456 [Mycena sanguinolenta]|nr:hypothetical protein C8R45DRAFT_1172456 [Mycena sanguinolenta]